MAAQKYPGRAEKEVSETLKTNVIGTKNLVDAARAAEVPQIVYASTGKALRPFSPDTYAASKKICEMIMAEEAEAGGMQISGARFTHVVDNSPFSKQLKDWIANDEPLRIHSPDAMFYLQSSLESSQLLMTSALEAQEGVYNVAAINNLDWPVNLADLALGAVAKHESSAPIQFVGYEPGYEEASYPGLYDPMTSGNVSPLINALEAPSVRESALTPGVDVFPLSFESSPELQAQLEVLMAASHYAPSQHQGLKAATESLSWAMLEARLKKLDPETLKRAGNMVMKSLGS